jgi:hypothetical protein
MYEEDFKKDPRSSSEIIKYRNNLFEELKKTRGEQLNDNKNPKSYCKEVICLNNMKVYDSLKEIEETFGINVGIYLRKGKVAHFSCGSDKDGIAYQWMYYDKYLEKIENGEEVKFDPNLKIATASKKKKKVICLNTGEVFDSMSDASNAYSASVLNALYNNMIGPKTCGVDKNGVINQWMYYDKYLKKIKNGEEVKFDPNLKESNFHLNERNKKSGRKLICLNDMKTYDSIKKVEEELGIYIKHYLYQGITTPKTCGLDKDGNFNKWMYYDKYLEEIENGKNFSIDKNLNPDKKRA